MDEPQPKWVRRFSIPYVMAVTMVAMGIGIMLAVRYG